MTSRNMRRRIVSQIMTSLCVVAVLVALVPVVLIFAFVVTQGFSSLDWNFFTKAPVPPGEIGGGMANAIVGSLILCGLGALVGVPVGILTGIYIVESGGTRLAAAARFAADTLNGVPSIVMGLFAYAIVVLPVKHFSALIQIALVLFGVTIVVNALARLLVYWTTGGRRDVSGAA